MKIKANNFQLKAIAVTAMAVSALVYAVANFYPDTQPPVLLGEYALKENDLLKGDTKAYRPWFENGAYMGDVIEYDIIGKCLTGSCTGTPGARTTTAPVGETDNTVLLAYANDAGYGSSKNWMARATFLLKENTVTDYWKARNVFTNNNGQVDFLWNNLTPAQKIALDSITLNDPDGDPTTSDAEDPNVDQPSDYFSPVLNFVLGDRSNERDKPGGFFRRRYSLLGDITNTPVYISPPEELLVGLNGFSNFAIKMDPASATPCSGYSATGLKQGCRPGRVAAPTNGGTLEVFDEADGSEIYAYIPSMVIGKLDRLAARDATYEHTFFLDGKLLAGSAQVDPDHNNCLDATSVFTGCNWRTILTGGGGPGFAGLFALDVTNPDFTSNKVLFEKTGNDIGHIYDQPRIAPLGSTAAPQWYVFTGNGYGSTSNEAKLLMISLDGSHSVTAISTGAAGGLSSPALLSTDSDLMVEIAFAGDTNGDLWMFRIDKTNPASSTAHKIFDGDASQPITNTPSLVEYPRDSGSLFLHLGTGSIFSELDALDDTSKQAIYGIWIKKEWIAGTETITPIVKSDLVAQTVSEVADTFSPDPDVLRVMSSNNAVDLSTNKGWTLEFPSCGERLVGAPFVRTGRVQFVTTNPTGLICTGPDRQLVGDSWIMSLNFTTGEDANVVVYNLNGDSVLDDSDKVGGKAPVGLHLGPGNISQPVLARLSSGIDKMYINGLILQIPLLPKPGPLLNGHIEVQTDSPASGEIAANAVLKHSEGYNIESNDGLAGGIDGHVHEYDTIHGVDHVDLFELEPRRGLGNLAASSTSTPGPTCSDAENEKQILVDGRCIEAVEGELNRAYDTYTPIDHIGVDTDTGDLICADGDIEVFDDDSGLVVGCREAPVSEVMALGSGSPLADNEEFIVVLANADLSFAGTLQIGCRVWPVVEYQDKVTEILESPTGGGVSALSAEGLVFTLDGILNDSGTCPRVGDDGELGNKGDAIDATTLISKGLSSKPTLRVGFGRRAILDEGVHGTRAQCVLGLHDYRDPVCYSDEAVLKEAGTTTVVMDSDGSYPAMTCSAGIPATPPDGYVKNPARSLHVTGVPPEVGSGFRWRNGALTLQLLDTDTFVLQEPNTLPQSKRGNRRIGGTFAKAFRLKTIGKGKDAVDIPDPYTEEGVPVKDANESGLLYEATMYWHYSSLADELRTADPASTPCYGDPSWKSRVNIELGGLTLGEYKALTDPLLAECENTPEGEECPLDAFVRLLGLIEAAENEDELSALLMELNDLLSDATNDKLALYAKYRDYAPGHIPEQHLLPWDVDSNDPKRKKSGLDAVPAKVISIETIDLETKGPRTREGYFIWTDIMQ
jgi:hypothetical protein